MEDKFKNLYEAIVNGDSEKAKHIAEEIAREKVDPIRVIDEVIRPAAKLVG
jgi:methanogenic corrinoid protein MtbC1